MYNMISKGITSMSVSQQTENTGHSLIVEEIAEIKINNLDWEREQFEDYMKLGEDDYLTEYHDDDENFKHQSGKRKGEWKYSMLPKKYQSTKSVILKTIDAGLNLLDENGNALGKTQMEKAYKEMDDSAKESKSDYEKAMGALDTFGKIFAKVEDCDERDRLAERVMELIGE